MELHEKLKFLRYANDFSSAYVAYKLKITRQEYEQLELGEARLTIEQAKSIGTLYAMTSEELMGLNGDLKEDAVWQNLIPETNTLEEHSPKLEELKDELVNIKELLQVLVEKLTEDNGTCSINKNR
ncbi:hypothetical protein RYH73_22630 [Olivibacter sp. CPCC 100613]|uniref:hypothetical protein n=1 Tax=Olivibacter sp. CPCC 100613 TaxID=3079931 RepID=UPI002FFC1224